MSLTSDQQSLQPGNDITLIEVDGTAFGVEVLRFHSHPTPYTEAEIAAAGTDASKLPGKPIIWQGQQYDAWPCKIEGREANGDGTAVSPKLTVANVDGSIAALCGMYQDMKQAKVIIHETFSHYLDAVNFSDGNPLANPNAEMVDIWYIDSKSLATDEEVQFKLSSPVDVSGQQLPGRMMTNKCTWCLRGEYRGADCGYTGTLYFDKFGNPVTNPAQDECAGTVAACKLRQGADSKLTFGGFPAIGLMK